jgi:hypothetical protein
MDSETILEAGQVGTSAVGLAALGPGELQLIYAVAAAVAAVLLDWLRKKVSERSQPLPLASRLSERAAEDGRGEA